MARPRPIRPPIGLESAIFRGRYVILSLLPFICFGSGLLPGRILSPADLLSRLAPWTFAATGPETANDHVADVAFQIQPWLLLARNEVRHGNWPLWNPYAYAGAPLLGSIGAAILSPFTILGYLLPATWAVSLAPPLKLAIAGCGMCWFLEQLGTSVVASMLGAVTYMFSGFMVAWLAWPVASVACWLPVACGLVEHLRTTGSWRAAGCLAVVLAVQFFGGQPETSLHVALMVAAWAMWRTRGSGGGVFLLKFWTAAIAGIALATVQWLPFLDYARECLTLQRRSAAWSSAAVGFSPKAMLTLLLPDWYGNHARGLPWKADGGVTGNFVEMCGSVGPAPVLLLVVAIVFVRRSPHLPFLIGVLAGALGIVYRLLPLEWLFRPLPAALYLTANRLLVAVDFTAAAVAALTLEALLRAPATFRRIAARALTGALALLVLVAAMLWRIAPAWHEPQLISLLLSLALIGACLYAITARQGGFRPAAWLLVIQAGLLMRFAADFHRSIPIASFYPSTPVLRTLADEPRPFRVRMPAVNVGAIWQLEDPGGYDAMNPDRICTLIGGKAAGGPMGNDPVWIRPGLQATRIDLLNVWFWVTPPGAESPMPGWSRWYQGPDATVYRNPSALPRALLVHHAIAVESGDEALATLDARGFNPQHVATLEGKPGPLSRGSAEERNPVILSHEPQRVVVAAHPTSPAYLVLLDRWDPGWRAFVGGARVRIERGDSAFRAVHLDAGPHLVEFVYAPLPFRFGLWVSVLAAGLLCALWLPDRRRTKE